MISASNTEQWKEIKGYNGYEISSKGRVRRKGGKVLNPWSGNRVGHLRVTLYRQGLPRGKNTWVHRLVALHFIGEPPKDLKYPVVCHNDGNPQHNSNENLRWGTRLENWLDYIKHAELESQGGEVHEENCEVPF